MMLKNVRISSLNGKNRKDALKTADIHGGSAMHAESHIALSADGVPIHYDVQGTGMIALVFVHGVCCTRRFWDRQVNDFAPQYTVVSLDLAGHGASGRDRTQWTMAAFGQDVVAVVEQRGLKQVVLIGHSLGGAVIVEAARRLPTAVIGLVGVDTWQHLEQPRSPEQVAESLAPLRADFMEATRANVRRMFVPTSDPTLVEHVMATMSAAPPHIGIGALEEFRGYDRTLVAGLHEVKAPKMAINSNVRPTHTEALRHGIEVMRMSGVGHFVMLEEPQTFNRLLDEAVKKCIQTV
jgi:pimeloyl-ACP methyl ester carboxylesterase